MSGWRLAQSGIIVARMVRVALAAMETEPRGAHARRATHHIHESDGGVAMAASVGFIGVGNMGNPMAGNVLKAGFALTVFDRHAPAMKNLIDGGACEGASAQDVVERSEVLLTCLPASPDVEAAYLDAGGLVERARPGTVLIDLSSVLPSTPRKIE